MTEKLLLCTDLDRTLLPNGQQPESPDARKRFSQLVEHPEILLVFVTGRHRALIEEAISSYDLPLPDYVIGDVGTSLYKVEAPTWRVIPEWQAEIQDDWRGWHRHDVAGLFTDLDPLELQEADKQNRFKLSYYLDHEGDHDRLMDEMQRRMVHAGLRSRMIWSVDESTLTGLLDVLPAAASKQHAIEFLMRRLVIIKENTVFAGDSGNDLSVLTSHINAVLVANATTIVRNQAVEMAKQSGTEKALYLAKGGFHGMNGNYSAGVLEGLAYYWPDTEYWYD